MAANVPDDPAQEDEAEDLPQLDWEIVARRTHLPESLRRRVGLTVATLRVPQQVDHKIRTTHKEDVAFYEQLEALLPGWKHAVRDPKSDSIWQVYIPLTEAHWLAVIIGTDRNDSVNLVSVFRIRTRNVRSRVSDLEV